MTQDIILFNTSIEALIDAWLFEIFTSKSQSEKTRVAYSTTLASFRETLRQGGLDLLSQEDEDLATIATVAQIWAGLRTPHQGRDPKETPVSDNTYNQRLAIISSFYQYLQSKDQRIVNPLVNVKRRKVQAYAAAEPLVAEEVAEILACIDRSTPQGKRDYALLAIALQTGRRAAELVSLRGKHIKIGKAGRMTLYFERCKGNKSMRDTLDPDTAAVLLDYLQSVYGASMIWAMPEEAAIWVSFSRQNRGQPISYHALVDICERYLGSSKTHALRHTFASESEKAGGTVSDIQHRLGHASLVTTSRYLNAVRADENPLAGKLARRFRIGEK